MRITLMISGAFLLSLGFRLTGGVSGIPVLCLVQSAPLFSANLVVGSLRGLGFTVQGPNYKLLGSVGEP